MSTSIDVAAHDQHRRACGSRRGIAVAAGVTLVASVVSVVAWTHADPNPGAGVVVYLSLRTATLTRAQNQTFAEGMVRIGGRLSRRLVDGPPPAIRPDPVQTAQMATVQDFDPTRVWLLEATDSATAARVAGSLVRDGEAQWSEPVVMREPADANAGLATQADRVPRSPSGLPAGFPNDPLFRDGRQWGLANTGAFEGQAGADIRAMAAWQRSCGAAWLRLAIADTGIDPAHPDLRRNLDDGPRIEHGLNVTSDPSGSWADSAGHGTAVAGVMAALTGDGAHFDSLGVAGVCGGDGGANPGCRIIPLKITRGHATSASSFDIARAIVCAVTLGARAVNLSFGGTAPSRLEREALRYAIERGCLVVVAAGNRGASAPRDPVYPAAYAADGLCLQVGASDPWDRRAAFSSYGPGLDLVAPGVGVWTTVMTYRGAAGAITPGYAAAAGTSFAAPFATGVAGLLAAARPELCADDLRQLLRLTARDIGEPGHDEATGSGVLDAAAALEALAPGTAVWHDEVAADMWLDAGIDSLVVGEAGPGNMTGPHTWPLAQRIEARATIVLPDSFADLPRVWPRVAGTSTVRGDFRLPYFAPCAGVTWRSPRVFELTGSVYRVASEGDSIDLPLPADMARFGFTVIGPTRSRRLAAGAADVATLALVARPNPFATELHIDGPAGADVGIFDLAGRRVRGWPSDGSVISIVWNGLDATGRRSPPGLYWVRARSARGVRHLRVIKLE